MIPIDRQIQQRMAAVGNSPDRAMQTFKQKGDVLDLMVLEQLVSQQRQLNIDKMKEQGIDPTTIYDKKLSEALGIVQGKNPDEGRSINEVTARTRDTLSQQQNIANAKAQRAGVTQPPRMSGAGGMAKMAGGGIVGFNQGGTVSQAEIDAYKKQNPNEPFDDTTIRTIISNMPPSQRNKLIEAGRALPKPPTPYSDPRVMTDGSVPVLPPKRTPEQQQQRISEDPFAQMNPKQVRKDLEEARGPKTPPPPPPDPNAGLPMIEEKDYIVGEGAAKDAMLDGGVGTELQRRMGRSSETEAGKRRAQVAKSVGRGEGIAALKKQAEQREALANKLFTPEQRARDRKRALAIGSAGRASTVGAGVAGAMMNLERGQRTDQLKNLDDLQELERKGIAFKQQTGEKMEESYDATLRTYEDSKTAALNALQAATSEQLATERANSTNKANIAIANGRTLNGKLDRDAMREHQRLNRESQARTQDTATLERSIATNQAALQSFLDAREERIQDEMDRDKQLIQLWAEVGQGESPTPEQQAKIDARKAEIRRGVMSDQSVGSGGTSENSIGAAIERLNEQLRTQRAELERRIGGSANTGTAQSSGAVSPK